MKKSIVFALIWSVILLFAVDTANGQTAKNPANDPPTYYTYQAKTTIPYWRSKTDTASPSGVKLSAASFLTAVITNTDTMKANVYFDWKPRGSNQWTSVYNDSVIKTTADTNEIKLRLPGTDRIGYLDGTLRARIIQQAIANYADSAQYYNFIWVWKP